MFDPLLVSLACPTSSLSRAAAVGTVSTPVLLVVFFFFRFSKLWPTYSSKWFCYVRVTQSNYVTLIAKAFSCSELGEGLEQPGQAVGGEIMVAPEIWDTVHSLLGCLLNRMIPTCIVSIPLERKCLQFVFHLLFRSCTESFQSFTLSIQELLQAPEQIYVQRV